MFRLWCSLGLLLTLTACSKSANKKGEAPHQQTQQSPTTEATSTTTAPQGQVVVPAGNLPLPDASEDRIDLGGGNFIDLQVVAGIAHVPIEGTLDDVSFQKVLQNAHARTTDTAELKQLLAAPLNETLDAIDTQVGLARIKAHPSVGFFTALVPLSRYQDLGTLKDLPNSVIINPVVMSAMDERMIRTLDADAMAALRDPRQSTEAFSGLKSMEVFKFLGIVRRELGVYPDGAQVTVGVADTGITFSHPAYHNEAGESRIIYMKDFTGEGTIYFHPEARFDVAVPSDPSSNTLSFSAEVLPPTAGINAPAGDGLIPLELEMQVSEELKTILLAPGSGAKLGIYSEQTFANSVDLNQNGARDDLMGAILVPTDSGYKVFFAANGGLDFRNSQPLGNWNDDMSTMDVVAEKIGFDIRPTTLQDAEGNDVNVIGATIVGFDPGSHGTHVAGIVGARKLIQNDNDETRARGVAPNTQLMMSRVCSQTAGCRSTDALIDMAMNGAHIINMSLGGLSAYNDGYSVQEITINRLTELHNVLFVISAGNAGPGINTVGAPSTARFALSVGATANPEMIARQYQWPGTGRVTDDNDDNEDFMLFFSSRGPTAAGGFKPNISAPGTELSAVAFNTAGERSGLDVYWGTSMSAPAASGAIALLLDAAKLYNARFPDRALPTDALTLRRIIIDSARPFDVTRFDPETGERLRGQYTWIDQGTGMLDLPSAWRALKKERDRRLPSAVQITSVDGSVNDIPLDYQVRVLRTGPNGIPYDGTLELPPEIFEITGPRFGRGIWLDPNGTESLINVQIARRLPFSASIRPDFGELTRKLTTTQDNFVLKTVYFGSHSEWLAAGTMGSLDCSAEPNGRLAITGEGAVDNFDDPERPSVTSLDSSLMVCLNRRKMARLTPGDHGAIIMAYRKVGRRTESSPSFLVPVYMTVPHQTLAGAARYEVNGSVKSFGVARHYVEVPEGTTLVSVKLEVPEAELRDGAVHGCAAVRLEAAEAGNLIGSGLAFPDDIARNCQSDGTLLAPANVVEYHRSNPNPGIWNLHIFGRYRFEDSPYKLTVEFAKVDISQTSIAATPSTFSGSIEVEILDASFDAAPDAAQTEISVQALEQATRAVVENEQFILAPNAAGELARQYDASVTAVTFDISGAPGDDLDLFVYSCAEATFVLEDCSLEGRSTTPTDVETVTFTPDPAKFYFAHIHGYEVASSTGVEFDVRESLGLAEAESFPTAVTDLGGNKYQVDFAVAEADLISAALPSFLAGEYQLGGQLAIKTAAGGTLVRIPVVITKD